MTHAESSPRRPERAGGGGCRRVLQFGKRKHFLPKSTPSARFRTTDIPQSKRARPPARPASVWHAARRRAPLSKNSGPQRRLFRLAVLPCDLRSARSSGVARNAVPHGGAGGGAARPTHRGGLGVEATAGLKLGRAPATSMPLTLSGASPNGAGQGPRRRPRPPRGATFRRGDMRENLVTRGIGSLHFLLCETRHRAARLATPAAERRLDKSKLVRFFTTDSQFSPLVLGGRAGGRVSCLFGSVHLA